MPGALGRIAPPDDEHVRKYPLSAAPPTLPAPVVIGVNWYTAFDRPREARGPRGTTEWWVGRGQDLGSVRGGHCVCLLPAGHDDLKSWWTWYNQVDEGICVGEGCSRTMSLLNRRRYQPEWLYDRCKERDGDPGGEGTYVRVGLDVLRTLGHVRAKSGERQGLGRGAYDGREPVAGDGIAANRWATSMEDVLNALGTPGADSVALLNSWGREYPHVTRMPITVLDRLRREDGEVGVVTDR